MKAIWLWACVSLMTVLVAGCGNDGVEKGVTVKGKIQKGGQVLKPTGPVAPGASKVEVIFYPSAADGVAEQAIANTDTGEFTLVGAGKGIKPGTYKVGVFVRGAGFDSDELGGKFNQQNTTISITIPAEKVGQEHDLGVIDIDNPPAG
jgi:hypothetical protein